MASTQIRHLTADFKYQTLTILNNKYIVGVRKAEDMRQIILTDLVNFYEESLSTEDLIKRCEDLNPVLIDAEFEEIVDDILLDIPKFVTSATIDKIELEKRIDDGRFWFCIELNQADSKLFYECFMMNSFYSFVELNKRYNYLIDLIKKKDLEIQEYKAQGISLLRKSVETEKFSEDLLINRMKNQKPMEKFDTFVDMMSFYHSISGLNNNEHNEEEQECKTESTSGATRIESLKQKNATKRTASSAVRCAVAPKLKKTNKTQKPKREYQLL